MATKGLPIRFDPSESAIEGPTVLAGHPLCCYHYPGTFHRYKRYMVKIGVRRLFIVLISAFSAYMLMLGVVLALVSLPPERFALAMSKIPEPVLLVIPFRQLWLFGRKGRLNIGDQAPDFDLQTIERNGRVQLSSFRGRKPVVLVFGSYT